MRAQLRLQHFCRSFDFAENETGWGWGVCGGTHANGSFQTQNLRNITFSSENTPSLPGRVGIRANSKIYMARNVCVREERVRNISYYISKD